MNSACKVMLLYVLYRVNSKSNHCLFSEHPSTSVIVRHTRAAAAAHTLEFEVSRCRRLNLQGVSCRPRLVCGMTFPTLCLIPERYMGLREQSIVGCFPEIVFQFFRDAGACGDA